MTHQPTRARACALVLLALLLPTATQVSAQRRNASQKKTDAQKSTNESAKPAAQKTPQTQQTTPQANGQKPVAQQLPPSILVRWQGKPGVNRYRLQLATDEKFEDIVFDQAVEGRQYVVKGLPPGNYFWRVAAAAAETSIAYTKPERVTLSASATGVEVASIIMPADAGWRTATGEVARLVPAQLRTGGVTDFVGVSSDGRVFAVDGASGISLWTARFNPSATAATSEVKNVAFAPLVVATPKGPSVVVAMSGGVRALQGETGREVWRAQLQGRASGGVQTDVNGDGTSDVAIVTDDPERFYILDGGTGRVLADQKLEGEAVGSPYPAEIAGKRGVLVSLKKGRVEFRGADGSVSGEAKVDEGDVTTAPLVVSRGQMTFMIVGTDNGLWAFSLPDLKVLGVIKADDDSIRGSLSATDVDGDGAPDVVMVTKRGRVALVNTTDGNVRWSMEGVPNAEAAAFADVNGDGVLDVIVPGGDSFALGFSGRDGSLVMKVEDGRAAAQKAANTRPLVAAQSLGNMMLVGGDTARMGIRALELPKGGQSKP